VNSKSINTSSNQKWHLKKVDFLVIKKAARKRAAEF
jgi:hypothetical protein